MGQASPPEKPFWKSVPEKACWGSWRWTESARAGMSCSPITRTLWRSSFQRSPFTHRQTNARSGLGAAQPPTTRRGRPGRSRQIHGAVGLCRRHGAEQRWLLRGSAAVFRGCDLF
jgi:hypothetical protein